EHTRTGKLDSINTAVVTAAYSVRTTPEEGDSLPGRLNDYSVMFETRYERTGDIADVEATIEVAHRAVDSTPEGHPDRAGYLNNLG
ncbi:hypothetical protein K432DRAFT_271765, partial [Lepidopterella palustris CBS 459.81]